MTVCSVGNSNADLLDVTISSRLGSAGLIHAPMRLPHVGYNTSSCADGTIHIYHKHCPVFRDHSACKVSPVAELKCRPVVW